MSSKTGISFKLGFCYHSPGQRRLRPSAQGSAVSPQARAEQRCGIIEPSHRCHPLRPASNHSAHRSRPAPPAPAVQIHYFGKHKVIFPPPLNKYSLQYSKAKVIYEAALAALMPLQVDIGFSQQCQHRPSAPIWH